jgi:hypothetical protein
MSAPFEDLLPGLYSHPLTKFGFLTPFNGFGDPEPRGPPAVKTPFKKLFLLVNFLTVFLRIIGK